MLSQELALACSAPLKLSETKSATAWDDFIEQAKAALEPMSQMLEHCFQRDKTDGQHQYLEDSPLLG